MAKNKASVFTDSLTDFDEDEEELVETEPTKKEETTEELQARIKKLEAELLASKTTIEEKPKTMAKGGIYKVLRTTTYKGQTFEAGLTKHLEDPNATNKWLKKIGEFAIDDGFQEDLNGKVRDHVEVDGKIQEGYRNK